MEAALFDNLVKSMEAGHGEGRDGEERESRVLVNWSRKGKVCL